MDNTPQHYTDMWHHADVYALADKYNIQGLKRFAAEKIEVNIGFMHVGRAFSTLARHVYDSTPDTDLALRDMIAQRLSLHLGHGGMGKITKYLLQSVPSLSFDILRFMYDDDAAPTFDEQKEHQD